MTGSQFKNENDFGEAGTSLVKHHDTLTGNKMDILGKKFVF